MFVHFRGPEGLNVDQIGLLGLFWAGFFPTFTMIYCILFVFPRFLLNFYYKSCVEQFKKVIRFCRLQFGAALTPDKQTKRGNWQIELTQIATTLEAHNCQPPVIFLGHLRDKKAVYA
jgi:hypothetical protein